MSTQWYARVMGEEFGPMSARELKAMAQERRLAPSDQIRKGTAGAWVAAERAKGLFSSNHDRAGLQNPSEAAVPHQASGASQLPSRPEDLSRRTVDENPRLTRCPDCERLVSRQAESCPHCGCRSIQSPPSQQRDRFVAVLLAWFFGVTGAHKLYLGKRKATLGYLLSSCTILLLPFVWMLSILDGLLILSAPRKDLLVETSWTWRPLSRYFKAALGWFFGVFLLIGGLGFLMEGSIGPGLLVLLGATALLPPVVPSLLGRAEDMEQLSAWIKAGAVVAVFLGSSLGTLNDVREIRSSRQTITRAPMIPFEVVDHESSGAARANWTIRVDFVGERLPTTQELRRIAEHLHDQSGRPERSFVTFWTPQQQPGRGTAFATGHHDPELEVRILSRPSPPGSRVVKSGLTESQRRTLYQKLVLIEDRFPGDKARQRPHKQKLYDQYGVDEAFEMEISVEAIERGWPLPDPVPAEH